MVLSPCRLGPGHLRPSAERDPPWASWRPPQTEVTAPISWGLLRRGSAGAQAGAGGAQTRRGTGAAGTLCRQAVTWELGAGRAGMTPGFWLRRGHRCAGEGVEQVTAHAIGEAYAGGREGYVRHGWIQEPGVSRNRGPCVSLPSPPGFIKMTPSGDQTPRRSGLRP